MCNHVPPWASPGSDCMFAVLEGVIEIHIGSSTVERVQPVQVFGEMGLTDQRPRSATAIAAVDSRVAVIDKKRFLRLVEQTPHFALNMMQVISEPAHTDRRCGRSQGP
jgi:CRP/FNR family transcriptional regulator, cyclic AMP receptor protein